MSGERVILPMSSGDKILPMTTARIAKTTREAFLPDRIALGGVAGEWVVNDILVNGISQLRQGGDIPGDLFHADAVDNFVQLDRVQAGQEVAMLVTYVGSSECGDVFVCGVSGVCESCAQASAS